MTRIRKAAIDPSIRPDIAPPHLEPKSLIVFCEKRSSIVVAIATDVEKQQGRIAGHFFNDYAVHEKLPLSASPQIGQPLTPH